MRHRKAGLKLNKTGSHRKAMFRNMVTSLFKHERIRTTDAKAKELRRWADKLITLAKKGDLHSRRKALSIIREKQVVHKLFEEAPERFANVNGGYTRVVKVGFRAGDSAQVSIVELVTPEASTKKKKGKAKAAPETTAEVPTKEEKPEAVEAAVDQEPIAEEDKVDASPEEAEASDEETVEAAAEEGETTEAAAEESASAEAEAEPEVAVEEPTAEEEQPDDASADDAKEEGEPGKE